MLTDPQQSVIRHGLRRWLARKIEPAEPSLADVIERKRHECALALLDAEADLDSAGCRVAALRIRLARLTGQANVGQE